MTTIASPRPSLALSSRRTSFSTDVSGKPDPNSNRQQHVTAQRRNRAALRDFYKLNDQPARDSLDTTTDTSSNHDEKSPQSIVDREGFDADRYVQELLERESLEGLMKVEAGLLKDIRGFDGERKSLVYDNYSKLIGATDTIKKMRGNMDPLKPALMTLIPAISQIADTARSLSSLEVKKEP